MKRALLALLIALPAPAFGAAPAWLVWPPGKVGLVVALASAVVYRMRVLEAGPERIVVETKIVSVASALATLSPASYVNRAAALYRHSIGVAPDREPPLAP